MKQIIGEFAPVRLPRNVSVKFVVCRDDRYKEYLTENRRIVAKAYAADEKPELGVGKADWIVEYADRYEVFGKNKSFVLDKTYGQRCAGMRTELNYTR